MSRIGKKPIVLEGGASAQVNGSSVVVKGPKGQLQYQLNSGVTVGVEGNTIVVTRESDHRTHRALHGLTRALIQNMVNGVTKGYTRKLEMQGVGYKAELKKDEIWLSVGFPKEKIVKVPAGIAVTIEKNTVITITGIDKALLGQFAAKVRRIRPPEPYKGKGIKFAEEIIVHKVGKTTS
jgi:large subunit ribosomal protein L6